MQVLETICKVTFFVALLFFTILSADNLFAQSVPSGNFGDFRGLWVVRHNMANRQSIDKVIDYAKTHGFKHLFIQVRGRGDSYYSSSLVPPAEDITNPRFDPLTYAADAAHEAGLKVHAWINVYLLWTAKQRPQSSRHLLYLYPEWTDADFMGVRDIEKDWAVYKNGMTGGIYLAPTHPQVNEYLIKIVNELTSNYTIDGLHFDYIRYQGATAGYNEVGRQKFQYRYGIDPLKLHSEYKSLSGTYSATWNQYRREKITEFVQSAHAICEKSDITLSAAVKPNLERANEFFFQEWDKWIQEDIIDLVIPMNYTPEMNVFVSNLNLIKEKVDLSKVVIGIGAYNQSRHAVFNKVRRLQREPVKGVCIFSYDSLIDDPAYMNTLRQYFSYSTE